MYYGLFITKGMELYEIVFFFSKYMLALKAIPYLKQSHGDIVMMSSISSRIAVGYPYINFFFSFIS